jgi:hypothetical protein
MTFTNPNQALIKVTSVISELQNGTYGPLQQSVLRSVIIVGVVPGPA